MHGNWAWLGVNDFADYPRLDRADLERIALGGYQVTLAPSYIQDQMLCDDSTEIQYDARMTPAGLFRVQQFITSNGSTVHYLTTTTTETIALSSPTTATVRREREH